jgi:signal transduction histidine kinase
MILDSPARCSPDGAWLEGEVALSTLTKIAIVVLVVLVLVAVPIFIQQAAQPTNWKSAFLQMQEKANIAATDLANAKQAQEVLRAELTDKQNRLESLQQQVTKDIDEKRTQIAQLNRDLADRKTELKALTANYDALKSELAKAVAFTKDQEAELAKTRTKMNEISAELRTCRDRNDELANELALTKQARNVLEEQLAIRENELKEAKADLEKVKAGGIAAASGKEVVPAPKITATITAVKDDLASLNVGSASGVKKGMEFIIYRNGDFVANLQIAHVEASSSAGIIIQPQRQVQQGDKATTKLDVE